MSENEMLSAGNVVNPITGDILVMDGFPIDLSQMRYFYNVYGIELFDICMNGTTTHLSLNFWA